MPAPPFSLIDTSAYGDSYIANAVSRSVAMYDPVASDGLEGRMNTLGFYGKTQAGDNHAVAKIQTHALNDSTRKGALQVLLNAGSGADVEFEALKVDANGAFAVQAYDAVAQAPVANLDLTTAGVLSVRTSIQAPTIEAVTELKGPKFDAIGTTVTLGDVAAAQFQVDTAAKKVEIKNSNNDAFLVDLDALKVSTTMNAQFDKDLVVGADAGVSSQFEVKDGYFKCASKASAAQYLQFNADAASGNTLGFVVQAPTTGAAMSKFLMADGKAQMIKTSDSKGLTIDHEQLLAQIDYNAELYGTLDVTNVASFGNNVTVGSGVQDRAFKVYGTAEITASLDVGTTLDVHDDAHFYADLQIDGALKPDNLDVAQDAIIRGNLTVMGATTTIESTTVTVADKSIELAKTATPTYASALGAGIEVCYPDANKTFQFTAPNALDADKYAAFSANIGLNIPSAYAYQIADAKVMTKDYVDLPEATGEFKLAGVMLLNKSQLVLQNDATSGEANVQLGQWRLSQVDGNLYIQKYDAGTSAWLTKAQYK